MKDNDLGGAIIFLTLIASLLWGAAVLYGAGWILAALTDQLDLFEGHPIEGLLALAGDRSDITAAWGIAGDPLLYWMIVGGLIMASVAVLVAIVKLTSRKTWGTARRERLGSATEVHMASNRDLEPLWAPWPPTGRFLLGRTMGRGRSHLLATEWRDGTANQKLSKNGEARRNDRGAVCVIGPSRSGKSVNVLAGILAWEGPVVLSSVKDDLVEPTLAHRRRCGEVGVFDPTETLLNMYRSGSNPPDGWDERLRVPWSPLRDASSATGAARAARGLADAGPERSGSGGAKNEMWINLAEQLLQGLLFVAMFAGLEMESVVRWVMTQDRPEEDSDGEVATLLELALASPDAAVREGADRAAVALEGVWSQDPKIASSIYVTATTLVEPWLNPAVARSAQGRSVDLDWLLSGDNSLYVTAAPQDAKRLSTVYGGIINDLIEQAFAHAMAHGPIDPPLLVVIDEAANMPLARLPEFASLVAGLGIQLVTVWQSLAQVKTLYGEATDTVITNHLTKVVFPGISDSSTLEYLSKLAGEEDVRTNVQSSDKMAIFNGSVQTQGTRLAVAPTNVIRTMRKGESMLIHGALPPAHVAAIPWYSERRFKSLQGWADRDGDQGLPRIGGADISDVDTTDVDISDVDVVVSPDPSPAAGKPRRRSGLAEQLG